MKRILFTLACTIFCTSFMMQAEGKREVVFAEIFYDTPLNENDSLNIPHNVGEYIKLQNISGRDIDIFGWKVSLNEKVVKIDTKTILPPGGVFLIYYEYRMPGDVDNQGIWTLFPEIVWDNLHKGRGHYSFYLGNTTNTLNLYNGENELQDYVTYAKSPLIARNGEGRPVSSCLSVHRRTVNQEEGLWFFDSNEYTVARVSPMAIENIKVYGYEVSDTFPPSRHIALLDSVYSVEISRDISFDSHNYVSEAVLKEATGLNNVTVTPGNSIITTQYFDGLGRKQQTVLHDGGKNGDISDYYEYNARGRQHKYWLPVRGGNGGVFTPLDALTGNYRSAYPGDNNFYNSTYYENSVEAPVSEEKAAGIWQNRDGVKTVYLVNDLTDKLTCRYYSVNTSGGLVKEGSYKAGELLVVETTDEDGHCKYEFTDKNGRTVLVRQLPDKNSSVGLDTYYVYDVYGNLCYVLPPEAAKSLSRDGEIRDDDDVIQKLCYIYKYDSRNRNIEKKLPGAGSVVMAYDSCDLLIYTQDGNQRSGNKYTYYVYDALGRAAFSGIVTDTRSIEELRSGLVNVSPRTEYVGASGVYGYTQIIASANKEDIQTVNFYDSYDFLDLFASSEGMLSYQDKEGYDKKYVSPVKDRPEADMLTGTLTRVFDSAGTMLAKAVYYDYRGNIVQSREQNMLSGYDINYYRMSFTGKPLEMRHEHSTANTSNVDIYRYAYDKMDRLLTTKLAHDNVSEKVLTSNTYDEIGRLTERRAAIPSTILNYKYNIRGWLKEIDGPMFKQILSYNDCTDPDKACYNGNISEIGWCDNGYNDAGNFEPNIWRNYRFTYDGFDRLVRADYGEEEPRSNSMRYELINQPDYSVQYSYDLNGNMKELSRKGMNVKELMDTYERWSFGDVDKLTLYYDGNRLQKVYDNAEDIVIEGSMDFRDGADTATEYAYDANGNMTMDLNKGITGISYNMLNLPKRVTFADGHITEYVYDASGRKLRVEYKIDKTRIFAPLESVEAGNSGVMGGGPENNSGRILQGTKSLGAGRIPGGKITVPKETTTLIDTKLKRDYCGSYIYKDGIPERVVIENGYIEGGKFHYYLRDYQGNNRVVIDENNRVVETNDYYPFGMSFCESSGAQPFKYGGKELDRTNGLNLYDFFARQHDSAFGRFTTMDALAEDSYSISPYAYCAGNPIKYIDPTGNDIWEINSKGEIVKRTTDTTQDAVYIVSKDKDGNYQRTYTIDAEGNKNYNSISFEYGTITSVKEEEIKTDAGVQTLTMINVKGDDKAIQLFEFLANPQETTNVEWSHDRIGAENSGKNIVGTIHHESKTALGDYLNTHGYTIREDTHSHPDGTGPSSTDFDVANRISAKNKNVYFSIYIGNGKYMYYAPDPNKKKH